MEGHLMCLTVFIEAEGDHAAWVQSDQWASVDFDGLGDGPNLHAPDSPWFDRNDVIYHECGPGVVCDVAVFLTAGEPEAGDVDGAGGTIDLETDRAVLQCAVWLSCG